MKPLETLLAETTPDVLERFFRPPELESGAELGKLLEELVRRALERYDTLPAEFRQYETVHVLSAMLGSWSGELGPPGPVAFTPFQYGVSAQELPLQQESAKRVAKLVSRLDGIVPTLHRPPLVVLLSAVQSILEESPHLPRSYQAARAIALLREFRGWLPPDAGTN